MAAVDAALTAPGQPFEIEEVVIRGVTTKVWKHGPATLVELLRRSRAHGDRDFLVYGTDRLTFAGHFAAAATLAHTLRDRFGVRKGDRVAIAMRNLPEWSVAFFAAAAAGAIVVPLNAWWTGGELAYGLADSGTRIVFTDAERADRIAARRGDLAGLEAVIVARPGAGGPPPGTRPWADVMGSEAWAEVMGSAAADGVDLPAVAITPDDDATIFYTSGTTGRPKGALGTHRNICTCPFNAQFVAARAAARAAGATDGGAAPVAPGQAAYLLSVPLFHATGCHSLLLGNLLSGTRIVMMHRWDAGRALELIEQERITAFGGVPTMALQVLDHPNFARTDTSSVRSVRYGGAPAPADLARRIHEQLGHSSPSNGYGMTETSALALMNVGQDYLDRPDSVGPPPPVVEVKVEDGAGRALPPGEVGELWVKGPLVVKGYWNQPEATAETFSDGWVRTGDVARIDGDGFVYIVDRAKDMLIRGGENVYCVEIESVLYEHPAVAEAAVIGIPHPTLGEEVGAVVTLLAGRSATESELRDFVAARLAAFKVPVRVWFHARELPRNPAGKVLKRELRAELLGA